jgi:hypothetical protein
MGFRVTKYKINSKERKGGREGERERRKKTAGRGVYPDSLGNV